MRRALLTSTAILAGAALGAAAAEPARTRVADSVYGFSLTAPSLGGSERALMVQRAVVAGPPVDGFAPNCNVQIQFVSMGLDAFLELSLRQFDAMQLEVQGQAPRRVSGREAGTFEYSGKAAGHELRFLALAVGGDDRVWLVTCTALAKRFEEHRKAFAEVIDSFVVEAGE